jgi:rhamnose utilization protein RhaD (predicted bifunctional aldolase and dehydrogenase)
MKAQKLSSWQSLNKEELFKMEYWELEQAKLKK